MNIAIDGPAGAGKSTIAKLASKRLNYIYVDTGAMYRSIALYFIQNNLDVTDEKNVEQGCGNIDIRLQFIDGNQEVFLNGKKVTTEIRREEVGNMASTMAAKKIVRDKLLTLQREIAAANDVIMDGRDIGTNVLPDAEVKIYLTASIENRANRRYQELVKKGDTPDLEAIKADIEKRDYQDMNREIAPLKQAEDAIYLDTSDMSIEEVVDFVCSKVK